jgi:aspartate-semialdehyde dehydrogenase
VCRRRFADARDHGGTVSAATRAPRLAVVGASSLIGEALIERLREQKFARSALHLLDDVRELGRPAVGTDDGEGDVKIGDVATFDFSSVDLAFFCARAAVAEAYADAAAQHAWVIDASSAFRGRADVPLVVADVNGALLAARAAETRGLIALPGSASTALATVLAPLHGLAGLMRADVATYQAVSGSGRAAMEGLAAETVDLLGGRTTKRHRFGKQIAFNVIPQVDSFDADGVSLEERRLTTETRRILALPQLALNATAVRVPVFFGHSFAIHASFERDCDVASASAVLRRSNGVALIEADSAAGFPTPATEALAPDKVYVGRLRVDTTRDRSLNFWVVADNVRKCAAFNAFSTAQILVNRAQ